MSGGGIRTSRTDFSLARHWLIFVGAALIIPFATRLPPHGLAMVHLVGQGFRG